jgi:branched-chain amino acid aminotransferase
MYSSWFGGIVTDPSLMLVPIDDHMVHRGDGIFEAFKARDGGIYLLEAHLDRLERSAQVIDLSWPLTRTELKEAIIQTVRAASEPDTLIRLYISRGPGDFSPQPYASIGPQVYVVVTRLSPPDPGLMEKGCSLALSRIPIKPDFFSTVKSCNYLPNAMMKKEAADLGVDYTIGLDEKGRLAEGPTENLGLVTGKGELLFPGFSRILRGTTLIRALELAGQLVAEGELAGVREADILPGDLEEAREVMLFGTTIDALPVVRCQGRPIGAGVPGPVCRRLCELLHTDQLENPEVLTPVE